MNQNEPLAIRRVIKARLLTPAGAGLPLNHAFAVGDLKIVKPDGTVANATNLPIGTANATLGTFDIQLMQAELAQIGTLRLQLTAASGDVQYWEWLEEVDPVPFAELLAVVMDPTNANNANYPANAATFQQQWNLLMAWVLGPGDDLYGPGGSLGPLTLGEPASPAPHRAEFNVLNGRRRWTKLDGT